MKWKDLRYGFLIALLYLGFRYQNSKPSPSHISADLKKQIESLQIQPPFQKGDLIFQTSGSAQSVAIQKATNSPYSHVGLIYELENKPYVFEAIAQVKFTPLAEWINRGVDNKYVVKRLKNAQVLINDSTMGILRTNAENYIGKNYDPYFSWNNEQIYCSELVWKVFNESLNIEIGQLQTLSDFDLSSDLVQKKLKERYGQEIPYQDQVISPAAMFNSELLETVYKN